MSESEYLWNVVQLQGWAFCGGCQEKILHKQECWVDKNNISKLAANPTNNKYRCLKCGPITHSTEVETKKTEETIFPIKHQLVCSVCRITNEYVYFASVDRCVDCSEKDTVDMKKDPVVQATVLLASLDYQWDRISKQWIKKSPQLDPITPQKGWDKLKEWPTFI